MKNKSIITLAVLAICTSIALTACSKPATETQQQPEETQTRQATDNNMGSDTETAMNEENTTGVDSYFGSKEEALQRFGLTETPKSFIAPSWTDCMFFLDAAAPIAGLPDNHHIPEELLSKYPAITDHDGNFDLEKIKGLNLDVVFVDAEDLNDTEWAAMVELKKYIDEAGIKTVELPKAADYQAVLKNVADLATIFGTEEAAKANIQKYVDRINTAKEMLSGAEGRKIAIISSTKDKDGNIKRGIVGPDSFANALVNELGLVNVATEFELKKDNPENVYEDYYAPSMKELADKGVEALVLMVRIKGEPEDREKEIEALKKDITEAFGADSDVVKNTRFDVVDHHGMIISIPTAIAGIENIADIASR